MNIKFSSVYALLSILGVVFVLTACGTKIDLSSPSATLRTHYEVTKNLDTAADKKIWSKNELERFESNAKKNGETLDEFLLKREKELKEQLPSQMWEITNIDEFDDVAIVWTNYKGIHGMSMAKEDGEWKLVGWKGGR